MNNGLTNQLPLAPIARKHDPAKQAIRKGQETTWKNQGNEPNSRSGKKKD
jgi:hypothetical protein